MKKPTPKKKQCKSSTSRRYKTFQNKARIKLFNMSNSMIRLESLGKLETVSQKSEEKITKIKA